MPPAPAAGAGAVDIRDVLVGIWRRRWLILLVTLIACGLGIAFVVVTKPVYESKATVMVENLETPYQRSQPTDRAEGTVQPIDVKSQLELVRSRDLAKRVISDLDLTSRPAFDPLKRSQGPLSKLKIALGFAQDPAKQTPEQRALNAYYDKLNAYDIPESKIIVIEFKSGNAQSSAELANTLAELYVTATREVQSDSTNRARDWLSSQIDKLRDRVVKSDAAVEEYRASAGLERGDKATLSTQELSELNSQIILAEAAKTEAEARAKAIRDQLARTGTVDTSVDVLSSQLIQRLREQQIVLKRTKAELSATYLPSHPRIKAVDKELSDLNNQIRNEALKIVESLNQQANIAAAREKSLRDSLVRVKQKVSQDNLDEVKLRALERDAKANRDLLESFLSKFSDASARETLVAQPGMARIISRADVPSQPSFPKPGPVVLLATLAGFGLALGFAFMAEVMKVAGGSLAAAPAASGYPAPMVIAPAATPMQMTLTPPAAPSAGPAAPPPAWPGAPSASPPPTPAPAISSLCAVPKVNDPMAGQVLAYQARTGEGDCGPAARTLASWAQTVRQTLGVKHIAVSGVGVASLQTGVLTAALARQLDAQGLKVVVIDADLDNEGVRQLMSDTRGAGLAELLAEQANFSDVVIRDKASNVHLIMAGTNPSMAASLVGSKRFALVLEALDQVYDVVLLHIGGGRATEAGMVTIVTHAQAAVVATAASQQQVAAQFIEVLNGSALRAVESVLVKDMPDARGDRRFRPAA